ncbi:putative reverse transcriptase domain-containing protein [Tanacetum coccineum]|uniref:Reverse transcriptase domain-containing protein n=1 Tax=Tanacetum coccineum TaxID=301880 RepID=A0ABQ5AM91_9ASTR
MGNITMDFITKLPRTSSGHDAIWVVVDRLTKLAHFLAIPKSGREIRSEDYADNRRKPLEFEVEDPCDEKEGVTLKGRFKKLEETLVKVSLEIKREVPSSLGRRQILYEVLSILNCLLIVADESAINLWHRFPKGGDTVKTEI